MALNTWPATKSGLLRNLSEYATVANPPIWAELGGFSSMRFNSSKVLWAVLLAGLAMGLAGCVTRSTLPMVLDPERVQSEAEIQRIIALESLFFDEIRINRVSFPLLKTALPLTGKPPRPYLGIYFANKHSFQHSFQETASELYGVAEELTILDVVPNSPADQSGLMKGDVLLSLNREPLPVGAEAPQLIDTFLERHLGPNESSALSVARGDQILRLEIVPAAIADYEIVLNRKQNVNARATGKKIIINRGLLRFAESDNELALVISHEIAHNVMRHVRAVMTNYAIGTLVDIAATSVGVVTVNSVGVGAALSQAKAFEAEADYVGLYIMAQAGLPIEEAPEFWRRMSAIYPGTIRRHMISTHPPSPERSVALEESIKEIRAKQQAGQPLNPDLRPRKKPRK